MPVDGSCNSRDVVSLFSHLTLAKSSKCVQHRYLDERLPSPAPGHSSVRCGVWKTRAENLVRVDPFREIWIDSCGMDDSVVSPRSCSRTRRTYHDTMIHCTPRINHSRPGRPMKARLLQDAQSPLVQVVASRASARLRRSMTDIVGLDLVRRWVDGPKMYVTSWKRKKEKASTLCL